LREGDCVENIEGIGAGILVENVRVGDVVELRSEPPLIMKDVGNFECRPEVERESEVLSFTVVVESWGKAWSEDDLFSEENVISDSTTDEKILIGRNGECGKWSDVVFDIPTVFNLSKKFGVIAVDIEKSRSDHQVIRASNFPSCKRGGDGGD